MTFENLPTCFVKISEVKFQKSNIWDVHFLNFSMLIIIRYFLLAISNRFWWKIGLEHGPFWYFFLFHDFWKSLNMFYKNLCDEVLKIKNLRCTFFSFFHADRHEIFYICCIQLFLVENMPRKLAIFIIFHNFMIFENLSTCLTKISVMKFQK